MIPSRYQLVYALDIILHPHSVSSSTNIKEFVIECHQIYFCKSLKAFQRDAHPLSTRLGAAPVTCALVSWPTGKLDCLMKGSGG